MGARVETGRNARVVLEGVKSNAGDTERHAPEGGLQREIPMANSFIMFFIFLRASPGWTTG